MLRAMIVDDEELSVKRLEKMLLDSGKFEICHAFLNPVEAYRFAQENPIDIACLDISMPTIHGLRLSNLLMEHDRSIEIVFVTGYDEYAVQAFDLNALDYLLKPVTAERMAKTLDKIGKRHRRKEPDPFIRIHLFDGLRLYSGDREQTALKLRSPKTEELLAFLVCRKIVSREEIIETLWGDLETGRAWKNLNSTLYYIRKAINDSQMSNFIEAGRNEIRIDEGSVYCDLYEFEQLLKQIRLAPNPDEDLFKQAEALYTGELLKGRAYEWANEQTRWLEQNYIELLEVAARYHLKQKQPQASLHYFKEILKLDAIREDIHQEVIRLYLEIGRKNEALRQYHGLEKLLHQELGMKPDQRWNDLISSNSNDL